MLSRFFPLSVLALGLAAVLCSCDPSTVLGPQAANADRYKLRVSYERGSCFGRCEVYRLDVYENGLLLFQGERFTDRPGTWERSVDRRRVTALLDSFRRADFAAYPRSFRSRIADAAPVSITYYADDGQSYATSFKDDAPAELLDLSDRLQRLARLPDYRPVTDTIANRRRPAPVAAKAREEIIVELKEGVDAATWLVQYGKQDVQLKNRVGPRSPYYVITANPNLMGAAELLDFLRQDANVVSAQLNAGVGPR